jgi:hypothetical protein
LISVGEFITILDSDDEYKPFHLSACLQEMENVDLICSTAETVVNSSDDYYVPDKNDLSKPIHLDDAVLFGTLFGHQKVFKSIDFEGGFAADSAFYERAQIQFRAKKVFQKSYIYYRNNPNSTCAVLKRELSSNPI